MNFHDEMKRMFMKVIAGGVEPAEWEKWWDSHRKKLEDMLNRGDFERIMPDSWSVSYHWMVKTQSAVAYHFYTQGRPVKISDYYEKKAQEEERRMRQAAMDSFYERVAPARQQWENYLEGHPTQSVAFDWKKLLGTPPGQKPAQEFSYKGARDTEQRKQCINELHLRLKENVQAKIAPLAKAYGMKKTGPKTFVREKNGLVARVNFVGYFRGGGYESMDCYLCPVYALPAGILDLPGPVCQGENFHKMDKDWVSIIESASDAVDADRVQAVNQKFDDILTYLAEDIFPEWQKIDNMEIYFAKERQEYLKATEAGPKEPWMPWRSMWDLSTGDQKHPWRADAYLFGVWDLLSGREEEGYARLDECIGHNADYMKSLLKQYPKAYNDPRDSLSVIYFNAQLFAKTKQITDAGERRKAIRETYEEVCRFMRYFHGLAKRVERS
ncbi:MAG: hypothetical protein K2N44_00435 [Lachnospiraceae bacterium]|nr:hypothetical protein [Lachnospiraceae bacterium]